MDAHNDEAVRTFIPSPYLVGTLIGVVVGTFFAPGGADGYNVFLRPWWPQTTVPAWVHLFTLPVVWLRWPLPWTILALVSVFAVKFAARTWDVSHWWVAMFSGPMLLNLWLGQIELFHIVGAAVGWLVVTRRLHPFWLGVAWVGLATKVQVGAGLIALFMWWTCREQGWKALLWSALFPVGVILVTFLLYGNWIPAWIERVQRLAFQDQSWNAALFPYGLVALAVALMPVDVGKPRRARMVAAATLLGSPYFTTYHCSMLLTMVNSPAILPVTWLVMALAVATRLNQWAWMIPIVILAWDAIAVYRARGIPVAAAAAE